MPIYEFQCAECDYDFEKVVPMSTKKAKCDKCGKECKTEMGLKAHARFCKG